MATETNGKATMGLVLQAIGLLLFVVAPLILMYSKLNSLEIMFVERLSEVETQFKASDQIRNVQTAGTYRTMGLLWERVYHQPYPEQTYYPEVARPR